MASKIARPKILKINVNLPNINGRYEFLGEVAKKNQTSSAVRSGQLQRSMKTKDTSKHKEGKNLLLEGERPLMSSNFRVGKGVQNDPKTSDVICRLKIVVHGR